MRKLFRASGLVAAVLAAAILTSVPANAASFEDFTDVSGHWAEAYLRRAVDEGLLSGVTTTSLAPDDMTDLAQAATILCRILEPTGTVELPELGEDLWFRQYAQRAMTLGAELDAENLTRGRFTRGDAFTLIAQAFRLVYACPDYSVLGAFEDAGDLTPAQRDAAASLVSLGMLTGSDGKLWPMRTVNRAELLTMFLRVAEHTVSTQTVPEQVSGGTVFKYAGDLSGRTFKDPVWIGCAAQKADLTGVTAGTVVVMTKNADVELDSSTSIRRLVLAGGKSSRVTVSGSDIGTLVIAPGGPTDVSVGEGVDSVEITGDNVRLTVSRELYSLCVSGSGNKVTLSASARAVALSPASSRCEVGINGAIRELKLEGRDNRVTLDSSALRATLGGAGCQLSGRGTVSELRRETALSESRVMTASAVDERPQGSPDGTLELNASKYLSLGSKLEAEVKLRCVGSRKLKLTWRLGESVLKTEDVTVGPEETAVALSASVPFADGMEPTLPLRVTAETGEGGALTACAPVKICDVAGFMDTVSVKMEDAGSVEGGNVHVSATIAGIPKMKVLLSWYECDRPTLTEHVTVDGNLKVEYNRTPTYTNADGTCRVTAKVSFTSGPDTSSTSGSVTVKAGVSAQQVLGMVSSEYQGDFTLEYALAHDYTDNVKTVFVNAKGFDSQTGYLIWVNRAYQRVNVFTGWAGSWKLSKVFLCGTGRPGCATPVGEYTVWKFQEGWYHSTYWCEPVVRFKTGSGYAFHSRLWNPGHETLNDARIGFPVSAGCVRMYDEDVQWLYDNIPMNTKVVVF